MNQNQRILFFSFFMTFFVVSNLYASLRFFKADLQSGVIARQKQSLITLVKKHPVVSIIIVGGVVGLVYKMTKNYRERGHLMAPPQWWLSCRNRNRSMGDNWPAAEGDQPTRWQPHVAEASSPRSSSESNLEDRDRARDWDEFETEQRLNYGCLYSGDFPRWRESKYGRGGPFRPIFSLNSTVNQVPVQVQDNRSDISSGEAESANDGEALAHFEAVLKHGTAQEQNNLGFSYQKGRGGLKKDMARALALFRTAADKNFSTAQNNLGHCYLNGLGVVRDDSKAFKLFELAATQGNEYAQDHLGFCYLGGRGVRKNLSKAFTWFRAAADNGFLDAQLLMCHILRKGICVSKDDRQADIYFECIKKKVGSEAAARKKLNECKLYTEFDKSSLQRGYVGEECAICQDSFQRDDWISILPCEHRFCQHCIATWFEERRSKGREAECPSCRRVFQWQEIRAGTAI